MANSKAVKLWFVNIISFILFSVLAVTGLLNWLVLPHGYRGEGSMLISLRYFFREVHQWMVLLFIMIIFVHLIMMKIHLAPFVFLSS